MTVLAPIDPAMRAPYQVVAAIPPGHPVLSDLVANPSTPDVRCKCYIEHRVVYCEA